MNRFPLAFACSSAILLSACSGGSVVLDQRVEPSPTASATQAAPPPVQPSPTPTTAPTATPTTSPAPTPTAIPTSSPTATPTASPTPGPISASPAALTFNGTGQTQTVTVMDPGYTGGYSVSGCSGFATYGSVTNGQLAVTSSSSGNCSLTIVDAFSHQANVSVTVTTLTVPVQ